MRLLECFDRMFTDDILSGPSFDRASAWQLNLPEPGDRGITSLRNLRVGIWFDEPTLPCDSQMSAVLNELLPLLDHAGARLDLKRRPDFNFQETWTNGLQLVGAACGVSSNNQNLSHTDWLLADRRRAETRLRWAEYFENIDVLLCPVAITPAIKHLQT